MLATQHDPTSGKQREIPSINKPCLKIVTVGPQISLCQEGDLLIPFYSVIRNVVSPNCLYLMYQSKTVAQWIKSVVSSGVTTVNSHTRCVLQQEFILGTEPLKNSTKKSELLQGILLICMNI